MKVKLHIRRTLSTRLQNNLEEKRTIVTWAVKEKSLMEKSYQGNETKIKKMKHIKKVNSGEGIHYEVPKASKSSTSNVFRFWNILRRYDIYFPSFRTIRMADYDSSLRIVWFVLMHPSKPSLRNLPAFSLLSLLQIFILSYPYIFCIHLFRFEQRHSTSSNF